MQNKKEKLLKYLSEKQINQLTDLAKNIWKKIIIERKPNDAK
tara:strand:+ start:3969 stop:4094 length:126 start_codon:yes stop_codon:yes gene_type:complete